MATETRPDPIDDEIAKVLAEHPGLLEELQDADGEYDAGKLETGTDKDGRRLLEAKGIRLSPLSTRGTLHDSTS
jgi:hypothetical protein